jgi:UDP-N-acetylmuramate dehydrogenase
MELGNAECAFAYRSSIFNTTHQGRYVILRVDFALCSNGKPRICHHDLQRRFVGDTPTIGEVREAVLQIRKAKAMVLLDGDPDSKSVGSFFKNPVLSPEAADGVEKEARVRGLIGSADNIPRFAASGGKEKLPAAWLIERAGFCKGYVFGHAGISSKHGLAFINRGGATAQDMLDLMQRIQGRVQTLFGIDLQPEPVFIGFG